MTEDEAKTKWCPFVRSEYVGVNKSTGKMVVIANRDAAQMVEVNDQTIMTHNCIGSDCMAWRESAKPEGSGPGYGYCGLAGSPVTP